MQKIWQRLADEFNIKKQADELGVKIWQAPSFLFIMMGIIIIFAMTVVYYITKYYDSPEAVIFGESSVVAVLFTIGNFIIKSIEEMARANKAKTEFVSIASHQLKTPLSEINWEIELLLSKNREGLSAKQVEIVDNIAHSNEKMMRLVNDLLDVARIDQGRLALVNEQISFGKIVDNVVLSNVILAESRNVKLSVEIDKDLPKIIADKRRIGVVLDNLISNGIKYTKEYGKVEVTARRGAENVLVCVKDNGVGIPKSQQGNVYQKFFRSDNAIKNQTDGTGLGLYIAKNIIEQSGGKIWFESEENKGTSFWFSLPVAKSLTNA